jgi:hypothetical protein
MCGLVRNGNPGEVNMLMSVDIGPPLHTQVGFGHQVTGDVMTVPVKNGFVVIGEEGKLKRLIKGRSDLTGLFFKVTRYPAP